jgi:hypothetical protein
MNKTEALRLADELEAPVGTQSTYSAMQQAAAELRRLQEENDLLASAADKLRGLYREERTELLRQRDQATAPPPLQAEPVAWRCTCGANLYIDADGAPRSKAEPVTEDMKSAVRWAPSSAYWSERLREFFGPDAREGIDALERRIAGAQEPVAWIHTDPDKPRVRFLEWREDEPGYRGRWVKTPLYLAPPQRKPLTEEEVDAATAQERDALLDHIYEYGTAAEGVLERIRKLCRATERAHGIKE